VRQTLLLLLLLLLLHHDLAHLLELLALLAAPLFFGDLLL
jgi:hypothetical protein